MVWRRAIVFTAFGLTIGFLLGAVGLTNCCHAAKIEYPDIGPVPPGVSFVNISESSGTDPVPLYGPPSAFSVGLDFDPSGFVATASGGASDVTDGQLNFTIMGSVNLPNLVGITSFSLFESGDYSLVGAGTAATQAIAAASIMASVTQINGVDVVPIELNFMSDMVAFDLAADPGVLQPWSLGLQYDVAGKLGPNQVATKIKVAIDNQLLALSETDSLSFISKKNFRIDVETEGAIPEPNSLLLVFSACAVLAAVWRRRR